MFESTRLQRVCLGTFVLFGAVFCLVAASSRAAEGPLEFDRYGGLKSLSFGPEPFFRTHYDGARWWLVTPEGGAFLSLGVCVVNSVGDTERGTGTQPYREHVLEKHGSVEQWAAATRERFQEWGLNTLGGWCSGELRGSFPYTVVLSSASGWGGDSVPDFFSPETEEQIRKGASAVDAYVNDPNLIGYFLDNELPWSFDWRRYPELFPGYMAMAPEAPGKKRLIAFFQERYASVAQFAGVWQTEAQDWGGVAQQRYFRALDKTKSREDRDAFVLLAARQYFKTATEALRAKDPNHLILGCRFVWVLAPKPVIQACGEFCDVVSINYYEIGPVGHPLLFCTWPDSMRLPMDPTFKGFHELTHKPLMITEFSFRGMDSGMPNTYPPGWLLQPTVPTQKDRADKFERYAVTWMSQPYFLGYHWFQYMDEPKGGRFDGENGNYGLVNIEDDPYTELTSRFASVNRRVWELHANTEASR